VVSPTFRGRVTKIPPFKIRAMAYKRKGLLTVSGEWAKHLRGFWKKKFWRGERRAGKKIIRNTKNERF
jgi:hypothetical protein